jgi:hypothetical protein
MAAEDLSASQWPRPIIVVATARPAKERETRNAPTAAWGFGLTTARPPGGRLIGTGLGLRGGEPLLPRPSDESRLIM